MCYMHIFLINRTGLLVGLVYFLHLRLFYPAIYIAGHCEAAIGDGAKSLNLRYRYVFCLVPVLCVNAI